jgi:hypothetical protein
MLCYNAGLTQRGMGLRQIRTWLKGRRVSADWRASLLRDHQIVFEHAAANLECSYSMLSVALDEAFALRSKGSLVHARDQVAVAAELLDRLAGVLQATLVALEQQGRHLGALPEVMPLDPANFRGLPARRESDWNHLFHRVLFSARSRFFHKVSTLDDLVAAITAEFREAAEEIADGASVRPEARWEALDSLHYDLNTCLRETIVVLKSFLVLLPAEQVERFTERLSRRPDAPKQPRSAPPRRPTFSRTRR